MKNEAFLFNTALLFFSLPAMAYIDPGSGSAIMSAVIGFLVAIGLAVKTYWYKIKALFRAKNVSKADKANEEENKPNV